MVFWRSKAAKEQAQAAGSKTAEKPATEAEAESAKAQDTEDDSSNVVQIASGRLSDRLADVKIPSSGAVTRRSDEEATVLASDPLLLPGQSSALSTMREALKERRAGAHLLILGAEGTGRRWAAEKLAGLYGQDMPAGKEWVYVSDPDQPTRLRAFSFPAGEGWRFANDVQTALAKSWTARARMIESDDHRLALNLLEEEVRHRGDAALDHLRRRAESQNIALVKSIDGYVLAPMHEGRMVRPEVFRALPEALQRDVEAKITALEGELHGLVAASPDAEVEASEKYAALDRHVAMSAVKPNLAVARKLYTDTPAASEAIDLVERSFVDIAETAVGTPSFGFAGTVVSARSVKAESGAPAGAPVVVARDVSRSALVGEIGRDTTGAIAVSPGKFMQSNDGFLIVEAWRLAAEPGGWMALCEAFDTGVFAPLSSGGLAVVADSVPFTAKVIVVADPRSWERLKDIDPGAERRFRHIARFAETAAPSDVSEPAFAAAAATIASENGLRAIYAGAGATLYKDAVARGSGRVSLDRGHLLRLLEEADELAASSSSDNIRASDMRRAIDHLAAGASA